MPRKSPVIVPLAEVAAFADRCLAEKEAAERIEFRRLGLNPDEAGGILRARDIVAAFGYSEAASYRVFQELLVTFPEKYERVQLGQRQQGITRRR